MNAAKQAQSEKAIDSMKSLTTLTSTASLGLIDQLFTCPDLDQRLITYRVRIFPNLSWFAVVVSNCSDRQGGPGITSSVDSFIPAFLAAHPEIPPRRIVVIEHYQHHGENPASNSPGASSLLNDERFNLVSFCLEAASARSLRPERKSIDRSEAELWTGASLD